MSDLTNLKEIWVITGYGKGFYTDIPAQGSVSPKRIIHRGVTHRRLSNGPPPCYYMCEKTPVTEEMVQTTGEERQRSHIMELA